MVGCHGARVLLRQYVRGGGARGASSAADMVSKGGGGLFTRAAVDASNVEREEDYGVDSGSGGGHDEGLFFGDHPEPSSGAANERNASSSSSPGQHHSNQKKQAQYSSRKNALRDDSYAHSRPRSDVPWLQDFSTSYIDEAERRFGSKETWASIPDHTTRMQLIMLLKRYLEDINNTRRVDRYQVVVHHGRLRRRSAEWAAYVDAGANGGDPASLKEWLQSSSAAEEEKRRKARSNLAKKQQSSGEEGSPLGDQPGADSEPVMPRGESPSSSSQVARSDVDIVAEIDAEERRTQRRLRGDAAGDLRGSVAVDDTLGEAPGQHSQYPFLRQRALQKGGKGSLDPSLVDWTSRYFPDDDPRMFSPPPEDGKTKPEKSDGGSPADVSGKHQFSANTDLEGRIIGEVGSRSLEGDFDAGDLGNRGESAGLSKQKKQPATKLRGRPLQKKLRATLKTSLDNMVGRQMMGGSTVLHDNDGVVFELNRATSDPDEPAILTTHKPRRAKGKTTFKQHTQAQDGASVTQKRREVVKVDWDTYDLARSSDSGSRKMTPEIHRAKERLARITRGEDPNSVF